ncbi:MAG: HNH endonuclease [Methanimicrococcus sp.]|nr:HNH endonuclease [Methanimicrococcus sp.]
MLEQENRKWTRDETILAFELYCTIPSHQVTTQNSQIIQLSNAIERTSNSVKLKLQNFKSYDPSYTQDGRTGLSHGSKLDAEVVREFLQNWDSLVFEANKIKEKYDLGTPPQSEESFEENLITHGYDKQSLQKIRVGQSFFRRTLFSAYGGKCCITGLPIPELLRASHIKPWSKSNDINEKTNPHNGLLLNVLHDIAFDRGYITIGLDNKVIVSDKLSDYTDEFTENALKKYSGGKISLPNKFKPDEQFIEYHNEMIFLG